MVQAAQSAWWGNRGGMVKTGSTWFERFLLPGLAFKAVVIGGGYATGRELATFFLPSGPWGGLLGMAFATMIWSVVAAVSFLFAFETGSGDYRTFFKHLLGPLWPAFEVAYLLAVVVILAVFAAAAGAIFHAVFHLPDVIGAVCLMATIMLVVAFGNASVEALFKYVTFVLYGTYILFIILSMSKFGDRMLAAFAASSVGAGWPEGGLAYAGYNILGAVVILPTLRHLQKRSDAVVAGLLAGPLAMFPAVLFFVCMVAYIPYVGEAPLPSDYLLIQIGSPAFRILFQLMIFAAMLESATGGVHAIIERINNAVEKRKTSPLGRGWRSAIAAIVLVVSVGIAGRFGLVALIASGLRWLSHAFLLIYVVPLLTLGVFRLWRMRLRATDAVGEPG